MKHYLLAGIVAFACCMPTGSALAQGKGGSGSATAVGVVDGSVTAVAKGIGSSASNEVGVIGKDVRPGANVTAVGVVKGDVSSVAKGIGGDAKTRVGGIVSE